MHIFYKKSQLAHIYLPESMEGLIGEMVTKQWNIKKLCEQNLEGHFALLQK